MREAVKGQMWECEVPWHTHTDGQRGPTCRPHPDEAAEMKAEHLRRVAEAARSDLMFVIGMFDAPEVRAAFASYRGELEGVARRLAEEFR